MKNRFLTLCAALFVAGALQAQDYTSYLFAYFIVFYFRMYPPSTAKTYPVIKNDL